MLYQEIKSLILLPFQLPFASSFALVEPFSVLLSKLGQIEQFCEIHIVEVQYSVQKDLHVEL
jgi:hypothetical protein